MVFVTSPGGGRVKAFDEGTLLTEEAEAFNFIGSDVVAAMDPLIPNQVDVYIPAVLYPPYYNMGAASVATPATTLRWIAAPDVEGTPFKIGGWAGGTQHPATTSASLSYTESNSCRFDSLGSAVEVNIYDADGVSVLATHTLSGIAGNNDVTVDNIRIQVTNWAVIAAPVYSARINVYVTIGNILPNSGRFTTRIVHHNGLDFTYTHADIFRDSNPIAPAISGCVVSENTCSSSMWLSGIKYYATGDTFDFYASGLINTNRDTYPGVQMVNDSSTHFGITNTNVFDGDFIGWSVNHNPPEFEWALTRAINIVNFRYIGTDAHITETMQDWVSGPSVDSNLMSVCIDTWNPESDSLSEYFTDEVFRRTASGVVWDSTQDMNFYDDFAGLMIQGGKIFTRRTDWNTYWPGLTLNPDYTGFVGWGTYYRRYIDVASLTRTSCTLNISGFTLTNLINSEVKIWIFIPGRFTSPCFVHGAATYNFATFDGDNDPIRLLSSTATQINVSFGTLGMTPIQNFLILHMEIQDSSIQPDSIVINW